MADKIFVDMKSIEEYKLINPKIPNEKPIIGYCPDWRTITDEKGNKKFAYMEVLLSMYRKCIEDAGGLLYIIGFDSRVKDVENIIDGYLIPGGRDIDPHEYGEERVVEIHDEAKLRFEHMKDMVLNLPKKIPILAVCLGFQLLNVVFNGKLEYDIKESKYHYKKRKFNITKGTILHSIVGDSIIGNCYHHQGIKSIGQDLVVNALDDYHQSIHGLEYTKEGKWILSVLWHPESSYESEKGGKILDLAQCIYQGFVDEVKKRNNK